VGLIVFCDVQTEDEAARKAVDEIWRSGAANGPPRGTSVTQRHTGGPRDADLPDSDDEDAEAGYDDADSSGSPWDDREVPLTTTITVRTKSFNAVEWMRPNVGIRYATPYYSIRHIIYNNARLSHVILPVIYYGKLRFPAQRLARSPISVPVESACAIR